MDRHPDDLDTFIQHWRAAFGEDLTRRQGRRLARRERELYAALQRGRFPGQRRAGKPSARTRKDCRA